MFVEWTQFGHTEFNIGNICGYPIGLYCKTYARGGWVEDAEIGPNGTYYKYRSDFDILAIVVHRKTAEKEGPWHRIQEQLRQASIHTPVTIIRHEMGFINKRLGEGNYFFADIQAEWGYVSFAELREPGP